MGVSSEGPGGLVWCGMLWMAGGWEGWISQAAVAKQPGAAAGGMSAGFVVQDSRAWLCPVRCSLFLHAPSSCRG